MAKEIEKKMKGDKGDTTGVTASGKNEEAKQSDP